MVSKKGLRELFILGQIAQMHVDQVGIQEIKFLGEVHAAGAGMAGIKSDTQSESICKFDELLWLGEDVGSILGRVYPRVFDGKLSAAPLGEFLAKLNGLEPALSLGILPRGGPGDVQDNQRGFEA